MILVLLLLIIILINNHNIYIILARGSEVRGVPVEIAALELHNSPNSNPCLLFLLPRYIGLHEGPDCMQPAFGAVAFVITACIDTGSGMAMG